MGRITKLERQKGAGRRLSVFVDDCFFAGLSVKAVRDLDLSVGQELSDGLRQEIVRLAARESALRSLARREHSRAELAGKLKQKGHSAVVIKSVLDELEKLRYLDDSRFARMWIERRSTQHPRGRRMLAAELKQKGIPDDLVRGALAENFSEDSERGLLIDLIKKRLRTTSGSDPRAFKRRLLGFLARRGFSYDDVRQVLAEHFPEL